MKLNNNSNRKFGKNPFTVAGLAAILVGTALFVSSYDITGQQVAIAQQTEQQQNQTQSGNATTIADTTVTDTFTAKGIITGTIQEGSGSQQSSAASNSSQPGNQTSNTTQTASSSPFLVGGDWTLDVESGNVTNFIANFTMVRTDGSEHHNHDITNFKVGNNTQFQLDPTGMTTINGTADIAVNGTSQWPGVDTTITIDKAEILTIQPEEEEAKQHFMGQPIYGIVLTATGANGTAVAESVPAGGNQTQDEEGGGILDPLLEPLEDLFS